MFGRGRQGASRSAEYARDINEQRRQKDRFFAAAPQSPLPHEERHGNFAGLAYYPPDPTFRVTADVIPCTHPDSVQMATSTGEIRPQARFAELRFHLGGRQPRWAPATPLRFHRPIRASYP